jgi:tRNA A22 N-methylase
MAKGTPEEAEEIYKVLIALQKKKDITGEPLSKAEIALGHILASVDSTHLAMPVYDALKKAGYIKK